MGIEAVNAIQQTTKSLSVSNIVNSNEKQLQNVPVGKTQPKKTPEFREYNSDKETYAEYKKARAQYYYKNDLKTGKLEYVEPVKVLGYKIGGHYYKYKSDEKETLGDIKIRYNLPDGTLKNQSMGGGGNFDLHRAPSTVVIEEETLQKAIK